MYGLKLNTRKTEYMEVGKQTPGTISIDGEELKKTTSYKYLGSHISAEGGLQEEVAGRMNTAWMKWKALTGVLCDRRMPLKLKSPLYRTVIRSAALYCSEC